MLSIFGHNLTAASVVHLMCLLASGAVGIGVITCSLYGWGRLARRLTRHPSGTWPVTVALGVSCVIFLGGLMNLCRLALPVGLAGIVFIGLTLTTLARRQDGISLWRIGTRNVRWESALQWTAALALTGFTIAFQLAPSLYNTGDDFQQYFPHVVRMVETGTLYGGPLNGLGGVTLGAQAFLQGFIVAFFPIRFINGADAVFCFFLCLVLPLAVTIERPALGVAGLAGTLAAFVIDPQYINVTSLFSMSAIFSALVILSVDPREGPDGASLCWHQSAAPALFYAGAAALKPTSLVFLGLHFVITIIASYLETLNARGTLARAGRIVAWALIFISPWLLLYSPYYVVGLLNPIGQSVNDLLNPIGQSSGLLPELRGLPSIASLLSPAGTFYGSPRLLYTVLGAGLLSCAVLAVLRGCREPCSRRSWTTLATALAAAGASYFFWVVIGPSLHEPAAVLRFSIPALIGTTSAALPLWAMLSSRRTSAVAIIAAAVLLFLFIPATHERVSRLFHEGTELAYLHNWSRGGVEHARHVVDSTQRGNAAGIRSFQELIPSGETLLVWVVTPFLLDFNRNKIIDMNVEGLGKPWARIPAVRYVLWQYKGYAVNTPEILSRDISGGRHMGAISASALDVAFWLKEALSVSRILRDEDGIVLFEIGGSAPTVPNPTLD